ncbi:MAG: IS30 family transposase [Butyrivibrio sp.]|jgi:IS30 family transposase|nr:IS30 family transposase [Butyrivibrio sp.]
MSTQKGNQKHLNLSDRINIEKGLNNNDSFATIAKVVQKDPTTISKEVRKHSKVKEYKGYANTPCEANKDKHSPCMLKHVCGDLECDRICRQCPKQRCSDICEAYRPQQCPKLSKAPYVCNGCGKRVNCMMEKKIYSSKYADDCYRETLSSSREGINQTPESIQKMNDILTPLIQKGQSIAHIYATHAEDLGCSKRTTYTYIDAGVFDVRNIDLRRKVKYKKRKKATNTSAKNRAYRVGHNYEDFQKRIEKDPDVSIVEMDCVEGKAEGHKVLLTFTFRRTNLMLIFLLDSQTQEEVLRVFSFLEAELGTDLFKHLFEVILTDGGSEFSDRTGMETSSDGKTQRTTVYYCDPYSFWQKGCCEKNHEYIRYVRKKGSSFDDLDQDKVTLLANHINNTKRDSLNRHSPFELSQLLLDDQLLSAMGYEYIAPDDVVLTPDLIK